MLSLAASELPDYISEIPDDWTEFTDCGIIVKVPAKPKKIDENDMSAYILDADGIEVTLSFNSAEEIEELYSPVYSLIDMSKENIRLLSKNPEFHTTVRRHRCINHF